VEKSLWTPRLIGSTSSAAALGLHATKDEMVFAAFFGRKKTNGNPKIPRWWHLKYFLFSPRTLGKIPVFTHIFQIG